MKKKKDKLEQTTELQTPGLGQTHTECGGVKLVCRWFNSP